MKKFNELTKKELANLNETQVDAYVDIELAEKGIVKPIVTNTEFPDFLKVKGSYPETDLEVYQVDGYIFLDLETAKKFAEYVGKIQQVVVDYYWDVGNEFIYAKDTYFKTPTVKVLKIYSEPKYQSVKEQIKQIKTSNTKKDEENENTTESVVNYEAIDQVKYSIRSKVRDAIDFFSKAQSVSKDYSKYFDISQDRDVALKYQIIINIEDSITSEDIEEDLK